MGKRVSGVQAGFSAGYRVTFDEVAVRMGSFAHYLGHGAIVTFQWPTGPNFWNYLTDCPRAERYT